MKMIRQLSVAGLLLFGPSSLAPAQEPVPSPSPKDTVEIGRNKKELAYTKLMEGQRFLWRSTRNRTTSAANSRSAKLAFQNAVELDPTLAEGYTALAEVTLSTPPNDVDGAIGLATISTKIEPNNFGAHRILARLFTFKSHFNSDSFDQIVAAKAISEWKEVTRLDPGNAEGWAFLSEFYSLAGRPNDQIDALKKWVASPAPLETQFYRQAMGGRGDLSTETASMKLGATLISSGRTDEAVEVLSVLVADNPDSSDAVDLLGEALETAGAKSSERAVEALGQAVFVDPANIALVKLLSQVYSRSGQSERAIKVLREAADRNEKTDKATAAQLQVQLGDLYAFSDKIPEAIAAYEKALSTRGIKDNQIVADSDRDFVLQVFEKMIRTYKSANRGAEVRAVIDRARKLLKKDDLFVERQLVEFYRESGRRQEALAAVRTIRSRYPTDYGLLRLEASVLTETGMVDQGVALVKALIAKPRPDATAQAGGIGDGDRPATSSPVAYDDFTNLLFISHLFMQANREAEASNAANEAYAVAGSEERRQLAKMSLASAQQMAGNYTAAETTLRDILKQTPGNPIALNNLGYFLLERNERTEEALGLIQRALKIDPTNPSYLDSLGWAHFLLGNLEDAEKELRSAARIDSASATIREHLGDVYGKQGKLEQARAAWRHALDLATNSTDAARLKSKLQK